MLQVTRINTGLNEAFTLVTVGFRVQHTDGTSSAGTVEVHLDGQSYTLDELKQRAIEKAREALELAKSSAS